MKTLKACETEVGDLFIYSFDPHTVYEVEGFETDDNNAIQHVIVCPVLQKVRTTHTITGEYIWKTKRIQNGSSTNFNPYTNIELY